jgi:acyl-CoA synthetase (AMP-forming)/AMP-acid ligase II
VRCKKSRSGPDAAFWLFDDIQGPECRDRAPAEVRFDDPACLALTSGTTGPSKAVLFSQATMLMIAQSYATSYGYGADNVYYICLPLFHTSGLRGAAYVALLTGGAVALAPGFSVSRFWDDIVRSGATTFDLLGAMATFLWRADPHPLECKRRVRMVRVAPVPPFGRGFEVRFGLRLVSTYGLTDGGAPGHAHWTTRMTNSLPPAACARGSNCASLTPRISRFRPGLPAKLSSARLHPG